MHGHEKALIDSFLVPARRPRYLFELASPRRRRTAIGRLNHLADLDERYATWLPSNADVAALLEARRAPAVCYVLGGDDQLDGRELGLRDAIRAVQRSGWGALIGCVPGRLAYYYDEQGVRRALLERRNG